MTIQKLKLLRIYIYILMACLHEMTHISHGKSLLSERHVAVKNTFLKKSQINFFSNLKVVSQWKRVVLQMSFCSRRAVQASSSYGPRVPPTPSLQSDTACQRLAGAAWCSIKDSACPVSVPCAEKCWSTPPPPPPPPPPEFTC